MNTQIILLKLALASAEYLNANTARGILHIDLTPPSRSDEGFDVIKKLAFMKQLLDEIYFRINIGDSEVIQRVLGKVLETDEPIKVLEKMLESDNLLAATFSTTDDYRLNFDNELAFVFE